MPAGIALPDPWVCAPERIRLEGTIPVRRAARLTPAWLRSAPPLKTTFLPVKQDRLEWRPALKPAAPSAKSRLKDDLEDKLWEDPVPERLPDPLPFLNCFPVDEDDAWNPVPVSFSKESHRSSARKSTPPETRANEASNSFASSNEALCSPGPDSWRAIYLTGRLNPGTFLREWAAPRLRQTMDAVAASLSGKAASPACLSAAPADGMPQASPHRSLRDD